MESGDVKRRPTRTDEGLNHHAHEDPLEIVYVTDVTETVPTTNNQKGINRQPGVNTRPESS